MSSQISYQSLFWNVQVHRTPCHPQIQDYLKTWVRRQRRSTGGLHRVSWCPTALHPLGPRSTSNQCILVRCEYLSQRKTPKKPLNRSARPPLAIFLVTIFRQSNTGQSLAPLTARCYCWQRDRPQLLLSAWPRLREDGEERATRTEQTRHVCQIRCQHQFIQTLNNPTRGRVLVPPVGKVRLWEPRILFRSLSLRHDGNGEKGIICRIKVTPNEAQPDFLSLQYEVRRSEL